MRYSVLVIGLLLAGLPGGVAQAQSGILPTGDYTCNARRAGGFGLTLGTMTLSGKDYRFSPPNGNPPVTTGTYTVAADGTLTWSGDIGAVQHAQIGQSHLDGSAPNSFWFEFESSPGSGPMPVSCGR